MTKIITIAALIAATSTPAYADSVSYIESANANMHRTLAATACADVRAAKYALQAYDFVNSNRAEATGRIGDTDPITKPLQRVAGRTVGLVLSFVLADVIGDMLSRRSPSLRCTLDARQAATSLRGIVLTNIAKEQSL